MVTSNFVGNFVLTIKKDFIGKWSAGVWMRPEIWVSNYGNDDTGNGSKEKPFRTTERAVIEANKSKVRVYIKIITEKRNDK